MAHFFLTIKKKIYIIWGVQYSNYRVLPDLSRHGDGRSVPVHRIHVIDTTPKTSSCRKKMRKTGKADLRTS